MAQPTNGMDGIEAVQHHTYPEVVSSPAAGAKEVYAYGPTPQQAVPTSTPPEKTICGLRRTTFILLSLLVLVVIAAAVGGGVGGSLAVRDAYDRGRREEALESAGDDESESGSRIKTPPTTGLLELDCPGIDDETQSVTLAGTLYEFQANCGVDRPAGAGGKDITRLPAYSYQDCITACAAFNEMDSVNDTECVAAHFNANLLTGDGGNCWLKSALGDKRVNEDSEDRRNRMVTLDRVS